MKNNDAQIIRDMNHCQTLSTCQDASWHVEMNNRDFSIQREVA